MTGGGSQSMEVARNTGERRLAANLPRVPHQPQVSRPEPAHLCPSEQRRRKYTVLQVDELAHVQHGRGGLQSTAKPLSCELREGERDVLIEGPLEQRVCFFFWRSRWCVLDQRELRIYSDERASKLSTEMPLESRSFDSFHVVSDVHMPTVFMLTDIETSSAHGDPILFLRTGPGALWEEFAASTIWQHAFRRAQRGNVGSIPWHGTAARPSLSLHMNDGGDSKPTDAQVQRTGSLTSTNSTDAPSSTEHEGSEDITRQVSRW